MYPSVVIAGVPILIPEGLKGERVSFGIVFMFTIIPFFSKRCDASFPVNPFPSFQTSTRNTWLSVPPEVIRHPNADSSFESVLAF